MKKFNVFVENMALLEEKRNIRWPGQKTPHKFLYQHQGALLGRAEKNKEKNKGKNLIQTRDSSFGMRWT